MQSASSRIWTRFPESISYDDNHYTTGTSKANVIERLEFELAYYDSIFLCFNHYTSRTFLRRLPYSFSFFLNASECSRQIFEDITGEWMAANLFICLLCDFLAIDATYSTWTVCYVILLSILDFNFLFYVSVINALTHYRQFINRL